MRETVRFYQDNNTSTVSKICADGNVSIQLDTIDHICPDATFIKMDIEGGEVDALLGGAKTIIKNKPKLAICIYHNASHLWEVALCVKKFVPEYRIFLRQHQVFSTELVLYADASPPC